MSVEAYTAYRRASRRRSSRTPFNPFKSIENEVDLNGNLENMDSTALDDIGIKIKTDLFGDYYTFEEELGRGRFATVKRCHCNSTGHIFAAKVQRKRRKAKDARNEILHEIRMLAICKIHPHIISLRDVFETRHEIIIVTDFASGGELYKHIEQNEEGFPETTVKHILRQTLEALTFLHARNIVHMDIKPQNLLLTESHLYSDLLLCDLGFSREVNSGQDVREIVGTPDFVAPEVLNYEPVNTTVDMWSLGVLTYMLLSGCSPFAGTDKMETFSNVTQAKLEFPQELFQDATDLAQDFMKRLLLRDPRERMSAPECLEHPWLEEAEGDKGENIVESGFVMSQQIALNCQFGNAMQEQQEIEVCDCIAGVEGECKECRKDVLCGSINSVLETKQNTSPREKSAPCEDIEEKWDITEKKIGNEHDEKERSSVECKVEKTVKESDALPPVIEENDDTNVEPHKQDLQSPLASPSGCRRTLTPSSDTVVEPFRKHLCRRDSAEVKHILSCSLFRVGKSEVLDLDDHRDTSAITTKRSDVIRIPITSVPHTKTLVTFYENLLQQS